VRDLIREKSQRFEVTDVTGAPWIEIDYAADVVRAAQEILPKLQPPPGAAERMLQHGAAWEASPRPQDVNL
jgi:hypothetical protein